MLDMFLFPELKQFGRRANLQKLPFCFLLASNCIGKHILRLLVCIGKDTESPNASESCHKLL